MRHCAHCSSPRFTRGQSLLTANRVTADGGSSSEAFDVERKTVTMPFADIKGSTELKEDLEPEEARAIIDPALKLMIDAVRR
jgi:class 3 adenylate cyclase